VVDAHGDAEPGEVGGEISGEIDLRGLGRSVGEAPPAARAEAPICEAMIAILAGTPSATAAWSEGSRACTVRKVPVTLVAKVLFQMRAGYPSARFSPLSG
jgi:hypothetical protein